MRKHKKLGYIVSMFPRLSETFIINEILELENLGFDLVVFSRKPAEGSPFHPVHVDFLNIKSPALLLGVRRFRDWPVPEALLSGNHAQIARWRRQQVIRRTLERRPDLIDTSKLGQEEKQLVEQFNSLYKAKSSLNKEPEK